MHIVSIYHEYPPTVAGGIGTGVAVLARGMARAGHRVTVVGFYAGVRNDRIDYDNGVAVHRYALAGNPIVRRWRLRQRLKKIHSDVPIDVIEWTDYGGWYLTSVCGATDVVKVHGGQISHRIHGFEKRRTRGKEYLELHTLRKIPNWIGVSQWFNDEWRQFLGVSPKRETIVYNPVDPRVFVPGARRANIVVYSGGLRRRKGVLALAKAARIFLPANPGCKLLIVGFDSDLKLEEVLREAAEGAAQIEFMPFMTQERLATVIASAGIFAMPSLYESCGNGWIEAMSCALPVVGSTRSCGPEVVADGQTGLLADPENPADVADKITRLLRNPDWAAQLGQAGRRCVMERFSLDIAVMKSEQFYNACLMSKGA
jgi:glycosyltransferase involved in cell wall biosynthesis